MQIVLNGNETVVLEDTPTTHGYRMISCSQNSLNPVKGTEVFFESPQLGAHPWISYITMDENGEPDPKWAPSRMPLSKSRVTRITHGT